MILKKKERVKSLKEFIVHHKLMDEKLNLLSDLLDCDYNSPLIKEFFYFQDLAIEYYSKLIGDNNDYLNWFICDNEYGNNNLPIEKDGKKFIISNEEELIEFLQP